MRLFLEIQQHQNLRGEPLCLFLGQHQSAGDASILTYSDLALAATAPHVRTSCAVFSPVIQSTRCAMRDGTQLNAHNACFVNCAGPLQLEMTLKNISHTQLLLQAPLFAHPSQMCTVSIPHLAGILSGFSTALLQTTTASLIQYIRGTSCMPP
jgi:hypothetical protein